MLFPISKRFILLLLLTLLVLAKCARTSPTFPGAEEVDDMQEVRTCKIQVQTTTTYEGKCIRLRGQVPACQSDGYLDIQTEECK